MIRIRSFRSFLSWVVPNEMRIWVHVMLKKVKVCILKKGGKSHKMNLNALSYSIQFIFWFVWLSGWWKFLNQLLQWIIWMWRLLWVVSYVTVLLTVCHNSTIPLCNALLNVPLAHWCSNLLLFRICTAQNFLSNIHLRLQSLIKFMSISRLHQNQTFSYKTVM